MNDTWNSPHPSQLRFSNCTLAADWASIYWRANDTGLYYTVNLVRNGLKDYFRDFNVSDPGNSELARWITYWEAMEIESVTNAMSAYAEASCLEVVCPRLGWQGLPDLAGLGVSNNELVLHGNLRL